MAVEKKDFPINFSQGLDLKTDPKQLTFGKFLELVNSVFTKGGLLAKRYGYPSLASLPDTTYRYASTFSANLTAIGDKIAAYSSGSSTWVEKGTLKPVLLDTLSLIRSNTNQTMADTAISPNGLICTVFTDQVPAAGVNVATYKYAVSDVATGQNIIAPAVITPASGTVSGSSRVFALGKYFIIVFTNTISGTAHLQYMAINAYTLAVGANVDISAQYTPANSVSFDGAVANDTLYLAWNGSDMGGAVRMTYITSTLTQSNVVSFATSVATMMSVAADTSASTAVIYASFYDSGTSTAYTLAVSQALVTILAPTQIIASGTILNITSTAQSGTCRVFWEVSNAYSYDGAIATNFVRYRTVAQGGTLGTTTVLVRSVGLASKAFLVDGTSYVGVAYSSTNQPSYFVVDGLTGGVIAKFAYSNGGGYYSKGLPSVHVEDLTIWFAYLIKDLLQAVNKANAPTSVNGIYTQTGVNVVSLEFETSDISTVETAKNLHVSGGILWSYDGYQAVEQGFHLWPDSIKLTASTMGGLMTAQAYFYQAIYSWTDNQGNIFRSAPSIPITVTTTGATSSVTVDVPTLRLTYKTRNPVKIEIYRYSAAQQSYYQVTSILIPTLNSTTTDSIAYVDTLADSAIIGNELIYTTGGVVENIGPPATSSLTLFKTRVVLLDAENKDLLWYSKPIIEGVPVEMSDLFTIFCPPSSSDQNASGPGKAVSAMDDKLILFKENSIFYVTGTGPDVTGANNDLSDPIYITSTVGCTDLNSIVITPKGIMFKSSKGIWLLGRDLSTGYIGAPVEDFNGFDITSAVSVPETNEVRFTLSNGVTLMYDYFFDQWGTFEGAGAIASTIFQNMHTLINSSGVVSQQRVGSYVDASSPVLMRIKTGWLNFAGLQGFQRACGFFLMGEYKSPHTILCSVAYDYAANPEQVIPIYPDNFNANWGDEAYWGSGGEYGGNLTLEQWEVYFERQKCQAFQITLSEGYDASFGIAPGAGFTLSGLNMTVGLKKGHPELKANASVG